MGGCRSDVGSHLDHHHHEVMKKGRRPSETSMMMRLDRLLPIALCFYPWFESTKAFLPCPVPTKGLRGRNRQRPSPFISLTSSSSSSNQDDEISEMKEHFKEDIQENIKILPTSNKLFEKGENIVSIFVRNLWKGITLPFPALRRVILLRPVSKRDKEMGINLSLREGVLALAAYLSIGVLAYHVVLEKWSIVDALYFTCVCFSTVGYGDLCPSSNASKIFTCLFGMGGIAFLGAAVATVGSSFVQAEIEAVQAAQTESQKRLMQVFEGMPNVLPKFKKQSQEEQHSVIKKARDKVNELFHTPKWVAVVKDVLKRALPTAVVILGGGAIMNRLNGGGSFIDSIYYALVTSSTIGFGDIAPQTRSARIFAIMFIPLSVAAAGELLSGIAMKLVERRQREVYRRQLESDLTIEHLDAMDGDGDGKITREEYIQFMLIEMGRVDKKEIDELDKQFDRLDVTKSGYLDNEDLELMAKMRGAQVVVEK